MFKACEIFKHEFVTNLLASQLVKFFFENRIIVDEVMAKSLVSCFLTHGVVQEVKTFMTSRMNRVRAL